MLLGIADRAEGNIDMMKAEIATWFDNSMDRLSGVYKRWAQLFNFLYALGLAIGLNISAIHPVPAL
jgi:hypothetical protein